MFKEWLKQFIAVCICVITILSSFSPAFADDYVPSDSGDDATYYIIEGKDVDSLFDFGIYDVDEIVSWIFQFKTYTVIKEYTVDGSTEYKMYFNTPNLQSILKNRVTSMVSDGYTDDTYKVEDTEWVVKVGNNADSENVITKYGFDVPSYTYFGEYPKEVMSTAGILPSPKKWWEVLWRAIKSLFGVSFIKAPDADNFNTITYLNHTYADKNDYILDFFCKYYLDYFERQIPVGYVYADDDEKEGDYFDNADEVVEKAVTEDVYDRAVAYNNAHQDEYDEACQRKELWDAYVAAGYDANAILNTDVSIGNRKYDAAHFFASIESYKTAFTSWVNGNTYAAYIMALALQNQDGRTRYGGSGGAMTDPSSYKITESSFSVSDYEENISFAADLNKYIEDQLMATVDYKIYTNTVTKVYSCMDAYSSSDGGTTWTRRDGSKTLSSSTDGGTTTSDPDAPAEMMLNECGNFRDNPDYIADREGPIQVSATDGTKTETVNGTTKTVTYDRTEVVKYTWKSDWYIRELYAPQDSSKKFDYDPTYLNFQSTCNFSSYTFAEEDIFPPEFQSVYEAYNANAEIITNYELFCEMLARGDDQDSSTSKKELLYRQCMITPDPDAQDGECWSKKYGDEKTSLTLVNVYAFSRIYEVTRDVPADRHELRPDEAHAIISKLQSYCGPYYTEVIGNMMKLMCATAKYEGNNNPTNTVIADDKRVMPYDIDSLTPADKANYSVTDPRVELYKDHLVGKLISKLKLSFAIGIYFKPQKAIISFAGKVTELSVFMQQLCNFDMMDGYGLSPTNLWTSGYVTLMMGLLAVFFIVKTVISIIKMGTNSGGRLVLAFFILVFELGLITAIAVNPTRVWNSIKNVENKVINLGEMMSVYSNPNLTYLYGNASDMEVTYYMPYLDTWSKYNTGYGILDNEQNIDSTRDYRELVDKDFPKIGNTEIKHWSVLLMDSFHYWGYSNSISNTISITDPDTGITNTYNGNTINNNAYRVIDHFMAPRVTLNKSGTNLQLSITENENYNGQLQTGVVDVLVKLLNCLLCCFLSLIKFMTFLWQWFVLYIFIFKVILGRGAENKKMSTILIETFSPTIAMIFIGMYAGIIMTIGMSLSGLIGIIVEIALFKLTFMLIRWWHDLDRNQSVFPKTLGWLYMLTNLSAFNRLQAERRAKRQAEADSSNAGMSEDYINGSLEDQRNELFHDDGQLKSKYRDAKYDKVVQNWYTRAQSQDHKGIDVGDDSRKAMRGLETNEKYSGMTASVRNMYDNSHNGKLNHNANGKISSSTNGAEDRVANMYGDNEPKTKKTGNEDDYNRTKTGSGQDSSNKTSPKKIGQSDSSDDTKED